MDVKKMGLIIEARRTARNNRLRMRYRELRERGFSSEQAQILSHASAADYAAALKGGNYENKKLA